MINRIPWKVTDIVPVGVEAVNTISTCSYPYIMFPVFIKRVHTVSAIAVGVKRIIFVLNDLSGIGHVLNKPKVGGADPHSPLVIFNKPVDGIETHRIIFAEYALLRSELERPGI